MFAYRLLGLAGYLLLLGPSSGCCCGSIFDLGAGAIGVGEMEVDVDDEKEMEESIATGDGIAEARTWLAVKEGRDLPTFGRETAEQIVNDCYAAGAPNVYIAFEGVDGTQTALMIVVRLGDDAATRAKLIEQHNAFWKKYLAQKGEGDPEDYMESDYGQKFIYYSF